MCPHTEDHHHIIQCQSLLVDNLWYDNIDQYKSQLRQMQAPDETIQAMVSLLNRYRMNDTQPIDVLNPTLATAVVKQLQLGPNCFIEGLLVHEWEDHISTFLPPKRCKHKWIRQLIRMHWDILWELWTNRCNVIHDRTTINKVHDSGTMELRIQQLLSNPPDNLQSHEKLLFQTTYSALLTSTYRYRKLWLQRVEKIVEKSINNPHVPRYDNERNIMRNWLQGRWHATITGRQPFRYNRPVTKHLQTTLSSWLL